MSQTSEEKIERLKINGIYRHFKGDYYLLVDVAKHSETGEDYCKCQHKNVKKFRNENVVF